MSIEKKIIREIERFKTINRYLKEQDAPLPPDIGVDAPPAAGAPPPPPAEAGAPPPPPGGETPEPKPIDVEADDEVEKIDSEGKSQEKKEGEDSEELDITDLVDSQTKIETKQEEYFNNLFQQLSNLENKLKDMDNVMNKLNNLERKIEKYREKSPQEKLDLRKYDSYPFNQKLSDFFEDKKEEFKKTGKEDYILTTDDVTDISDKEIKDTFQPTDEDQY